MQRVTETLQQEQERQDRVSYTPAESTMVEQPKVEAKPVAVGNPVEDVEDGQYADTFGEGVKEGGKAYMKCRVCDGVSHL